MTELETAAIDNLMDPAPPISSTNLTRTTSEADDLRVQLVEAQRAQQTAEIALAHEREANIAERVRTMIDNAIRERIDAYQERDRMRLDRDEAQDALGEAQHTVRCLEQQVAKLMGEHRGPGPISSRLSVDNSGLRFSPLSSSYTRHNQCCPIRAPRSVATSTFSRLNTALSPASMAKSAAHTSKYIFLSYLTTAT